MHVMDGLAAPDLDRPRLEPALVLTPHDKAERLTAE